MPAPKSLAGYPDWFFTIAERAQAQGYQEDIPLDRHGACVNLRQRFYKFRQLLAEAGHPHARALMDLMLTIQPGNKLRFSKQSGLTPEAIAQLGMASTSVPSPLGEANAADRVATSDEAEEALNRYLNFKPASPDRPLGRPCPPHEWDSMQTHCLHCGAPWQDDK